VTDLLDRSGKSYPISGELSAKAPESEIRFDRVSFSYAQGAGRALDTVSLSIPARRTTAIVGPSGAGKSTLINLILRLYDVKEGKIYVDGTDLADFDRASWVSRVSMVSQEIHLFDMSVRDNIVYGRFDATDEEIIAAARRADAHEFICGLPQGYDTLLGENGVRISGGQRQRISLARAIVRKPEVLILDEATNALDTLSEHVIQQGLDAMSGLCTIIVIAHRLSTVKSADQIVVMNDGRVCEQGTFDQLLELGGLFAQLYQPQLRQVTSIERSIPA
jgi:subfamily B ATP-binding cassette protein MsbA